MEIWGFNHDDLATGGKAGITFGMRDLMANTRQMNNLEHQCWRFYRNLRCTAI